MLNVPELERRWRRRRQLKRRPYIVAALIGLAACGALFYAYVSTNILDDFNRKLITVVQVETVLKPAEKTQNTADETSTAISSLPHSSVGEAASASAPAEQKPLKLTPSMQFMETFAAEETPHDFSNEQPVKKRPAAEPSPKPTEPAAAKPAPTPAPVTAAPKKPETSSMQIQRDDGMEDLQDVIARFKKNKNPVLSLFIAKRYYQIGEYQQSYNYALITNELDSTLEDSWLIFAKSLYKLGHQEMAVKTLKTYLNANNSVKAKFVLDQMEKGTFR